MALLSAIKVLLFRYTGQGDISIGSPIATRQQNGLDELIGFFVNTVVLRSELNAEMTFSQLLHQVKQTTLEAYAHQDAPFEKVVDAVVSHRDLSRSPLFEVLFVLQNTPEVPELNFENLALIELPIEQTTAQFDISFSITQSKSGLAGSIEYKTDLFLPDTILRMVEHFKNLIDSIIKVPDQKIGYLDILSKTEEYQILKTFNNNQNDDFKHKSIIDVFEEQVSKTPDAIALIFNGEYLSYKKLNEKANQISHYLKSRGVKSETVVGICIERSLEMIIGILGIIKSGGAYLPLDPEYPQDRIDFMLQDSKTEIVLTSELSSEKLHNRPDLSLILLDKVWDKISKLPSDNLSKQTSPQNLAYIIYTSGSTGKPKGVMIEHKGVVNLAQSQAKFIGLKAGTRSLLFASISFDASCFEIFNTILSGGTLFICKKEDLISAEVFEKAITLNRIEVSTLPPSFLEMIKDNLGTLNTIISAGEPLSLNLAKKIISKNVKLINAYGPTETTVCAAQTDKPVTPENQIIIGKPLPNQSIYILSESLKLNPVGITGEICISGQQIARGYLNREDLSKEKFIHDPFSEDENARLYKNR